VPLVRVPSVDVFRGAVIALMVFVNYMGGMKGAPWWTQHVPRAVDGYTLTDLVFPWFLFLAGVSIPLSLRKYLAPAIPWRALGRVLPRAAGLILLGVVFVNEDRTNAAATGMSRSLWLTLVLTAAVVLWRIIPSEASARRRRVELVAKGVAALLLAVLLVIWRGRSSGGAVSYLHASWWGILGLIGWCYLVVALAFLAARGSDRVLLGLVGLFICISIGGHFDRAGILAPLEHLFTVREICGSLAAIVAAGAVAGVWIARPQAGIGRLVALGAGLWAAGWLLRPLHGYHKLGASEGWALVAAGQATLLLALVHLTHRVSALGRAGRWLLAPFALVGANALLAYVLPDWLGAVAGLFNIDLMPYFDRGGAAGLINAVLLTAAVLAIAAFATRRRFAVRF
jgi:predicted acyltransferase